MGFDEGMTIVANEMSRIMTIAKAKETGHAVQTLQTV
jgi:hypothetical protein